MEGNSRSVAPAWWHDFFDATYRHLWSHLHTPELCQAEAQQVVALLGLHSGDRILDAPCGYGRISLPLARLGLHVTGVDCSAESLAHATEQRDHTELDGSLRYLHGDLRDMELAEEFPAAINLFSSIGYSSEQDDYRMLANIHNALQPGGALLLETIHRDAIVHRHSLEQTPGMRGPDGMTLREKTEFDPIAGTIHSTWIWNSPTASGSKHSVMRVYSATEIVSLLRRVGFARVECFVGYSREAFHASSLAERLGVIATKHA